MGKPMEIYNQSIIQSINQSMQASKQKNNRKTITLKHSEKPTEGGPGASQLCDW